MPCWCQRLEEASQTSSRWWEGKGNSNKHSLQLRHGEKKIQKQTKKKKRKKNFSMPNSFSVKADAVQHQKTTGGHSCQLQRGNRGDTFHWITTSGQKKTGKPLPDQISQQFLLQHLDDTVRILWKQLGSTNPLMVQAGEDMGDIFSPHFTPLPVAYNFHAFKVTVYSSSDSGHKAKFILNLFLAHDSEFTALKRPNKQQISNL